MGEATLAACTAKTGAAAEAQAETTGREPCKSADSVNPHLQRSSEDLLAALSPFLDLAVPAPEATDHHAAQWPLLMSDHLHTLPPEMAHLALGAAYGDPGILASSLSPLDGMAAVQ